MRQSDECVGDFQPLPSLLTLCPCASSRLISLDVEIRLHKKKLHRRRHRLWLINKHRCTRTRTWFFWIFCIFNTLYMTEFCCTEWHTSYSSNLLPGCLYWPPWVAPPACPASGSGWPGEPAWSRHQMPRTDLISAPRLMLAVVQCPLLMTCRPPQPPGPLPPHLSDKERGGKRSHR